MIEWMNAVGKGLPATIRLAKLYTYKGNVLFARWYGRYSADKSSIQKMFLILWNGEQN
jgi:hypothetical protein